MIRSTAINDDLAPSNTSNQLKLPVPRLLISNRSSVPSTKTSERIRRRFLSASHGVHSDPVSMSPIHPLPTFQLPTSPLPVALPVSTDDHDQLSGGKSGESILRKTNPGLAQ